MGILLACSINGGSWRTCVSGATAWTTSAGAPAPATAAVNNNLFQITGANDAQQTWTSQSINIAAFTAGVNLRVDLSENGTLDANDSVFVYYRVNGGPLILFSTNGFIADDFAKLNNNYFTDSILCEKINKDGMIENKELNILKEKDCETKKCSSIEDYAMYINYIKNWNDFK